MDSPSDEGIQAQVIAFLSAPSTHGGRTVKRISTHGAHVFLAGCLAYKLKRAVKLPFLDFSTIERRHRALVAELALNRKTAPSLYREVRSIGCGPTGSLEFGGDKPTLDWVLVMNRFDQEDLLDAMAARGDVTSSIIDDLADVVMQMHRDSPSVVRDEAAYFKRTALDNLVLLRDLHVDQRLVVRLERTIAGKCDAMAHHLSERVEHGYVRHCHGDLHLRNIVLLHGKPTPFDALEFNPDLATGDVYFDLAFLLMDLKHRGLSAQAHRLFNRYCNGTGDLAGLKALPLFLAVRATIRAKVTALAAVGAAADRPNLPLEGEQYLKQAEHYLDSDRKKLVAIGGLSGTGKSTVAMAIASRFVPAPGAVVLRTDVVRKRIFGVAEDEHLPPEAYISEAGLRVYDAVANAASRILATGYSCIVDAVCAKPEERNMLVEIAGRAAAGFTGVWLQSSLGVREARVGQRIGDASDANVAVARAQENYDLGLIDWLMVDADGPLESVVSRVIERVGLPETIG